MLTSVPPLCRPFVQPPVGERSFAGLRILVEGVDGIGAPLVRARSRRALLRADLDSVAKDRYLYLYWVVGAFGERAVCVRGSEDSRAV